MESLLANGGHFLAKDFSAKLFNYSKNGIQDLQKIPSGMNATTQAVLSHSAYQTSPVNIPI